MTNADLRHQILSLQDGIRNAVQAIIDVNEHHGACDEQLLKAAISVLDEHGVACAAELGHYIALYMDFQVGGEVQHLVFHETAS